VRIRCSWTLCATERPAARLRLFCFPHAGVGASAFRGWADTLGPDVEVHGIQLPGREARLREPCFASLPGAAKAVAAGIEGMLGGRFALFGHSMGALLAFEVARELARRGGEVPVRLLVSGRRAPHRPLHREPLAHLPHDAFVAAVRRRFDGIPRQVLDEPELLELLVPTLRADMTMIETYTFTEGPPLACPITAYGGDRDEEAPPDELGAWRVHTASSFDCRSFPGNHFFVQSERAALLADLAARLAAVDASAAEVRR